MPVYSNLTSCGSCLSYGFFWILHTSGIQDCWNEVGDVDDLAYATEPGQSCADIFANLGGSHWGFFAWMQMVVSLFIGVGFYASFQVVYERYGKYGPMNPRFQGVSGFFRFLLRFACSCFGFAGAQMPPLLHNQPGSVDTLSSVATTSAGAAGTAWRSQGTQTVNPAKSVAVGTTPPPATRDAGTEPVADPVAEPVAEPVADPVAEPVAEPVVEPDVSINDQVTPPARATHSRSHSYPEAADTSLLAALPCDRFPPPPPHPDDFPRLSSPASSYVTPANTPPALSPSSSSSDSSAAILFCAPPRRLASINAEKKNRQLKKDGKI